MYNKSRSKGLRNEYLVRDYFRSIGYRADRVPSSGASQGFKGDIRVISDSGNEFLVEVKSRKDEFKNIYVYLENICVPLKVFYKDVLIIASFTFSDVVPQPSETYPMIKGNSAGLDRILRLKKYVKDCDYLVIKDDRKPLIFIRFT